MVNTPQQIAASKALEAKRKAKQNVIQQPVSEIVPTQATTEQPTNPTQATDKQRAAWDKMDYAKQQDFLKNNTGFDPTKYNLSSKSANVQPETIDNKITNKKVKDGELPASQAETVDQVKPTAELDNLTADATRLQQVSDNLTSLYKSDQSLFTDRQVFDKYFKFGERGTEQKQLLNQFYTQREAERKIIAKGAEQIAKDGDNVDFLKVQDPQFYNEIQKAKTELVNKEDNTNTLATLASESGFPGFDKLMTKLESKIEDVKGIEEYPEIKQSKDKVTSIQKQIADIDSEIEGMRASIISQFPGVPDQQISDIVNDRTKKQIETKNSLIRQMNEEVGYANNRVDVYNLQKDEVSKQIDDFSKLYGLYQETPEGITEQVEAKYNAENPDLNSSDEATATRALNQTLDTYFADYQSIIQRPKAQVVADVLAYAKSKGISVSQALKENFIAPLMGKKEYQQLFNKALGFDMNAMKMDENTIRDPVTRTFKTVTNTNTSNTSNTSNKETSVTPSGFMEAVKIGNKTVQIDSQAASALEAAASELGNTISVGEGYRTKEKYKQIILDNQIKWNNAHPNDKITGTDIEEVRKALNAKGVKIAAYEASQHTGGLAIDLYNSQGGALNAEQVAIMEKNGFKQTAGAGDMGHWTYQGKPSDGSDTSGIQTDYGVPMSYDRSIKNTIPTQLMNSEVEKASLEKNIKSMYDAGIPEDEVALVYMGFNVKGAENKALAKKLVNVARMLPDDLASMYVKSISDLMNNGNANGALIKAEQTAYKYAKTLEGDNWISESVVKTATSRANDLETIINNAKGPTIGTFNGTLQNWLGKIKGPDAQTVRTNVKAMVADIRQRLSGSAVTPSEEKFLEDLIPNLGDTAQNFAVKLNKLKTMPLEQLNGIRSTYGLPELDEASLLDMQQRLGLYSEGTDGTDF